MYNPNDIIHITCPKCKGAGSIMKFSGGVLVHVSCTLCEGEGGQDVSRRILNETRNIVKRMEKNQC